MLKRLPHIILFAIVLCIASEAAAQHRHMPLHVAHHDSLAISDRDSLVAVVDTTVTVAGDIDFEVLDSIVAAQPEPEPPSDYDRWVERPDTFNPSPTRAVWMSALCPGLGQLYNRRFWKLPIVIGAYMGLGYATSWNNTMLSDYTKAYRDIMDNDPGTNSYMNFFPPTTQESDLDKTWLKNILKARKDNFRRNRDLCIICMVGVYLIAMVDAYVDASLSHFDITPDLTMDWTPAVLPQEHGMKPSIGISWALNF